MRILHILDSLDVGGVEVFLMNLYRNIDRSKIIFDFVVFKNINYFETEVINYGSKIYYGVNMKYREQMIFIANLIKNNNYRIVHCHNCSLKGMIKEIIPVRLTNRNTVIIAHSHNTGIPSDFLIDKAERFLLKEIVTDFADHLFACSYQAGLSKFNIKNKKPIKIIKNGIKTQRFAFNHKRRQVIRDSLSIKDDVLVFGTVGRLEEQKNHEFLIRVYSVYLRESTYSRLIIIGNGKKKKGLQELVKNLHLDENVIFLEGISDVSDYLMAMDVFVFPSLYEGLGIALIEAQASGLPCLISDSIPEEAVITKRIQRLPLQTGAWVYGLKNAVREQARDGYYKQVRAAGYDIETVAKDVSCFYSEIVEK